MTGVCLRSSLAPFPLVATGQESSRLRRRDSHERRGPAKQIDRRDRVSEMTLSPLEFSQTES